MTRILRARLVNPATGGGGGGGGGIIPGGTIGVAPRVDATPIILSGTQSSQYTAGNVLPNGTILLAGTGAGRATWTMGHSNEPGGESKCIVRIGDGDDISWQGGHVAGPTLEDGTWPWNNDAAGSVDFHDQAGMAMAQGKRFLCELAHFDNKGDSIQFQQGKIAGSSGGQNFCQDWVTRFCCFERMGDDCLSNDFKDAGTVYDCFMSAFSSMMEARPGSGDAAVNWDQSSKQVVFEKNLMWLRHKRFTDSKPWASGAFGDPTIGRFFKWQVVAPVAFAVHAVLRDNVFLYTGINGEDQSNLVGGSGNIWGSLKTSGVDNHLDACSGNVALFPGRSSGFPTGWPSSDLGAGFTYLYSTAAETYWVNQVSSWKLRHPEVAIVHEHPF